MGAPNRSNNTTRLYHASDVDLNVGDVVTPKNYSHAYASNHAEHARQWGQNVYSVEPVDAEEMAETTKNNQKWLKDVDWDPNDNDQINSLRDHLATVNSKSGFKVKGKEE